MTQEDKDLLLKDLCARLPYGVIINAPSNIFYPTNREDIKLDSVFEIDGNFHVSEDYGWPIETCKPYLRPLSSMTEEEYKEYDKATDLDVADSSETLKANLKAKSRVRVSKWYHGNDWLNAHHFDYRGLITKGLALEAPEGMYNT